MHWLARFQHRCLCWSSWTFCKTSALFLHSAGQHFSILVLMSVDLVCLSVTFRRGLLCFFFQGPLTEQAWRHNVRCNINSCQANWTNWTVCYQFFSFSVGWFILHFSLLLRVLVIAPRTIYFSSSLFFYLQLAQQQHPWWHNPSFNIKSGEVN